MPTLGWVCVSLAAVVGFVLSLLVYFRIKFYFTKRYYQAHATPLVGWIVQAPTRLFIRSGRDSPVQVLIAFDTAPGVIDEAIGELARRMAALKGTVNDNPIIQSVAKLVNDEDYDPYRRYRLPDEFTNGRVVYSYHVWVFHAMLPTRRLRHPFVRCLIMKDRENYTSLMDEYLQSDQVYMRGIDEIWNGSN